MEIAVLGGGNGCHAAAVDLSERGHNVRYWRRDTAAMQALLERPVLRVKDFRGERDVTIHRPTADLGEAITGAELIVIPLPAYTQVDLARRMAPHLEDGQVIFLPPGTFGSYAMLRIAREAGCTADVAFAETGTLPWLVRKHGEGTVAITTRATRLPTGVLPRRLHDPAIARISEAFPDAIEPIEDALSGALMNAGPIIHPPLIMMNAGPIEHFDHWDIHNEGTQPSIRRVTTALDNERIAVREALGYRAPHFPLANHYDDAAEEWMYGNLAHDKLVDSGDWRETLDLKAHRYMVEDIGHGLAFLVSMADWTGVPAPVAAGLLALGSAVAERDWRREGRTVETLGLADLGRDGLDDVLENGLPAR